MSQDFMTIAQEAAHEAGELLLDWRGRFQVKHKGHADLVTQADEAAQEAILRRVRAAFPDHGFIGEEQQLSLPGGGEYVWIVDPLDGTTNYVHDLPIYAVSIALARGAELVVGVIYNPATGECFAAERGGGAFLNGKRIETSATESLSQALVAASLPPKVDEESPAFRQFVAAMKATQAVRRLGSSALNLAYVAAGRLDAYWATTVHTWDVAAGMLLAREAGGAVSHVSGAPFYWREPHIAAAATEPLRVELLTMLKASEQPAKW